jgi:hypothetical protein
LEGITDLGIYINEEDNLVKIDSPVANDNNKLLYLGSYDKLLVPGPENLSYPITVLATDNKLKRLASIIDLQNNNYEVGSEPVRIKYKSSTHGVFAFKESPHMYIDGTQHIIPSINT